MSWWEGPWECEDCTYTARDYPSAEEHRRDTKHTLEHTDE